jgi:hypothetical protein
MKRSHKFQTLFDIFRIFKSFGHTVMVVFPSQDVQFIFWSHGKDLKFR